MTGEYMCPHQIDPKINYRRLNELSEEFTEHWNQVRALYLDAAIGFRFVSQYVVDIQNQARAIARGTDMDSEEFQDTRGFLYSEILAEEFVTSAIQLESQGHIKRRNMLGGENFIVLAQSCIVSLYTYWDEYLRREYAIAKGYLDVNEKDGKVIDATLNKYVPNDLWGDLRLFRNAIIHRRGKAGPEIERCKVLTWFKPGDAISITPDRMRVILLKLLTYRNELFKEQFPPSYIKL